MKCLVTSLICGMAFSLAAQPVVNRSDVFDAGDQLYFADVTVIPDPGLAGANVTWDFSTLSIDTMSILGARIAAADTTPYFASYPTSTMAQIVESQGQAFYQYYRATDQLLENQGEVFPGYSTKTYSDPEIIASFPMTYNNQWVDDYAYELDYTISPVTYTGEGHDSSLVDAYGTMMLPQATFDNVLRVKTISYETDTASLGQGLYERNYYYDTSYFWISPSYPGPLANYSRSRQDHVVYLVTGDTTITDQETYMDESFSFDPYSNPNGPSAVSAVPGTFDLRIAPNPFLQNVQLSFDADRSEEMHFLLQDMNGRVVYRTEIPAASGANTTGFRLPDLPSGIYVAILQSSDGADVQKLAHFGSE